MTDPRPRHRRVHHRPNEDRVVLIDVDGVLADMNAYEYVLVRDERLPDARWGEFFGHIRQAAVVDAGLGLVRAFDSAGYTVVYSTTRPSYTHGATRGWLAEHDFPAGRALLSRPYLHEGHHPAPAWTIKLGHARAVTNKHNAWLKAFVDDDPAIVDRLTVNGIPALDAATLADGGVDSLCHVLDAPLRQAEVAGPGAR